MTFQLTYKDLANPNFVSGLRKICQADTFKDQKAAYNAARIGSLLDSEMKTFYELREKMRKKFQAAKPENEENPTEADLKVLEELKAEGEKFAEISFTLERYKIEFDQLQDIPLTPNEILALTPLLDGFPDQEKKPDIKIVKDFPN